MMVGVVPLSIKVDVYIQHNQVNSPAQHEYNAMQIHKDFLDV